MEETNYQALSPNCPIYKYEKKQRLKAYYNNSSNKMYNSEQNLGQQERERQQEKGNKRLNKRISQRAGWKKN